MTTLREAAQQALEALLSYEQYIDPLTNFFGGPKVPREGSTSAKVGDAIEALRAALAEPVQDSVAWAPVTEAMPKSGVKVLACYRNRLGNLRRIRAMWAAAKTEEASSEDAEACSEYDEATDTYYVTEGWYECIDNWGDYSSVAVTEGEVTHWMPLPPDPDSAPPQQAEPTSRASLHVEPVQEHLRGAQSGEPLANRLANHPRTLGSPMSDQGLDDILSEHVTVTDPNLHGAIYMAMRDLEAAHGIVERPCTCHPDDSPPTPQQEVQE